MTALALVLIVAALGYGLARWTRLPVIPLLLLGGIALANSGVMPKMEFVEDAFVLGLEFLLFAAGMELNPSRFGRHIKTVLWVGLAQFCVVGGVGFFCSTMLGFSAATSAYLGLALSTSSTLVVVNHLKQQQQMFEPFARLVVGVLLIQDFLIILVLVVLQRWNSGIAAVSGGLLWLLALSGLALACQRWVLPRLMMRKEQDEETLLLGVLALLFLFVGITVHLNIPPAVGAFLAGFALANFPINGVARGLLLSLTDFFQAIFFTLLGSMIVLPEPMLAAKALALTLVVLMVSPPLVAAVAEWQGLTARPAIESGLLLAQTSEFALVLGLAGSHLLGHVHEEALVVIVMVAAMTMTLTPFIATDRFTTFLLRFHPSRRRENLEGKHKNHVLMLGFGEAGMYVLRPLLKQGYEVVVVDDDPAVIQQLGEMNVECIRGDGGDVHVLERASARQAKLVLASMRRVADGVRVLNHVRGVPVVVRVFEIQEAETVQKLGGIPVLNSEASADKFMEWFNAIISPTPEPA